MDWISTVTRVYRFLSERGRRVDVEEVRKWFQPLFGRPVDELLGLEEMDKLVRDALPEGPWQPAVALSQTILLLDLQDAEDARKKLSALLRVWSEKAINYSALLSELRKRVLQLGRPHISIIETLDYDPDRPSYFSSEMSASGVDFFLNYLRFEEGVDVEELVEGVKKLVEKEQNVEEFLRLVGIDELIGAEEFLARVEKAADVLAKAKEQGLDVEEVLRTWDKLANGGGDRFRYLEEAVKAVAQREVGRKFWEEVERVLGEQGVRVSGIGSSEVAYRFFYLELSNIEGLSIDLEPAKELLHKLASFMKKVRPVTLFTADDVEKIFRIVGIFEAMSREEVERAVEVLTGLDRLASNVVLEEGLPIFDVMKEVEEEPKTVAEKVSKAVREGYREGMKGESLLEYIRKKVQA